MVVPCCTGPASRVTLPPPALTARPRTAAATSGTPIARWPKPVPICVGLGLVPVVGQLESRPGPGCCRSRGRRGCISRPAPRGGAAPSCRAGLAVEGDALVQVAHADHRVQIAAHGGSPDDGSRPSRNSPAWLACWMQAVRSVNSVPPASNATPRRPAAWAASMVRGPMVGRSARRSCPGLTILTSTPPGPGPRQGGRRGRAWRRCPRSPSTASTMPCCTTQPWPDVHRAEGVQHGARRGRCRPGPPRPDAARLSRPGGPSASVRISCAPRTRKPSSPRHLDDGGEEAVIAGEGGAADARQQAGALGIRTEMQQAGALDRADEDDVLAPGLPQQPQDLPGCGQARGGRADRRR